MAASSDEIAASTDAADESFPRGPQIIAHMNEDHADSILVYALHYAGFDGTTRPRASQASITSVDYDGLLLSVEATDGSVHEDVRVRYPRGRIKEEQLVRKVVVEMHHEAYKKLGLLYQARSGYLYKSLIRDGGLLKDKKKLALAAAVVGVFAGLAAARSRRHKAL